MNDQSLGRPNPSKKRPLLLTFNSKSARDGVIAKAKELKSHNGPNKKIFEKVFIKKDMHPLWRKEHDRLRKVVQKERAKPENEGVRIIYDTQQRVVLRDEQVIDRFHPFF